MFTAFIQIIDLLQLHQVGLFLVFFVTSWSIYIAKLVKANRTPTPPVDPDINPKNVRHSVSVIVPVVDEPLDVWQSTLEGLQAALKGIKNEVIIVANGGNGKKEAALAEGMGFDVIRLQQAGKRLAIHEGAKKAQYEVVIILDSDTFVSPDSIKILLQAFDDKTVGGATPKHLINRSNTDNWMRAVSDWLEDIRFEEVLKGQNGAVGCLPGRMLAVRTELLKKITPNLMTQTFLGKPCISGDDRYLTSWLLEWGWKTVYIPEAVVLTEAPDTLKQFIHQRLRWSRTSFRETIRSLPWIFNYPFTALTTLSNVILRWTFFVVIVTAVLSWVGIIERTHVADLPWFVIVIGTVLGFLVSAWLRQLRHILKNPLDVKYFLQFIFVTTFILTPLEWFGNISVRESHWMTRKLD